MHDRVLQHHIITQSFAHVLSMPFAEGQKIVEETIVPPIGRGHKKPDLREQRLLREPRLNRANCNRSGHSAVAINDTRYAILSIAHSGYGLKDRRRAYFKPQIVIVIRPQEWKIDFRDVTGTGEENVFGLFHGVVS